MIRSTAILAVLCLLLPLPAKAQVPLEDLVRLPEFTAASLSPDGRHLAVATPVRERSCITVINIEDLRNLESTLNHCPPGTDSILPGGVAWLNEERLIYRTSMQLGELAQPVPTGRIFGINIDGSRGRQLHGPVQGALSLVFTAVSIIDPLPDDREHILVSTVTYAAHGERLFPRVERLNAYTGRTAHVIDSPLERGYVVTDGESHVRFASGTNVDGDQFFAWRRDDDSPWIEFESPFEADIWPLAFSEDEESIIVASRQEGELGLWRVELESGEREALLIDERSEVRRVIYDRDGKRVIGAGFEPDFPRVDFVDPEHPDAVVWQRVIASFPGREVTLQNFTDDGRRAVVSVTSDREPISWYLLDADDLELRFLLASRSWIDASKLSPREPFRIRARDGLELTGYLTLPPDGREQDLPAIVLVHGGPHGVYDTWGFQYQAQLFASRGYAVVQINYRGSGGYGQQFERAGYRRWGTTMQDDVTDATRWLINEGIADADRICIFGGSYGGYAVLAGITREPELYACAFTYVGVYDLDMMWRHGDIPERPEGRAFLARVLGDRRADADDIAARSPINHVARIKTPLFVAHGFRDERVPVAQYNALRRALRAADIPHETLLFRNEGHGVSDPDNRVEFYTKMLEFFDSHTAVR